MKWFLYKITLNSGVCRHLIFGGWLKTGDYKFGKVEKIKELNDIQVKEHYDMADELYKMWCKP